MIDRKALRLFIVVFLAMTGATIRQLSLLPEIKDWVEKKARRHLGRSGKRQGFGWNSWSRQWLYETVGLFNGYRVNYAARYV